MNSHIGRRRNKEYSFLWRVVHSYQISPFLLRSHNISYTESTSSHTPQQQGTLHAQATTLYEPFYLSSNVHISLDQLHNSFYTFEILPQILPATKNEATQLLYNYQIQHALQTAKIFKYIGECTFCRTQLVAMHNTVMTRNTNAVPPSETHRIPSSSADRLTVLQFKY